MEKLSLPLLYDRVQQLLARFAWQRISATLLNRLVDVGLADVAYTLVTQHAPVQSDPQMGNELLYDVAVKAGQLEFALSCLSDEGKAISASNGENPAAERAWKERACALAELCYSSRKPELGKACYELVGENMGLVLHHATAPGADPRELTGLPPTLFELDTLASLSALLSKGKTGPAPTKLRATVSPSTSSSRLVLPTSRTVKSWSAHRARLQKAGKPFCPPVWLDNPGQCGFDQENPDDDPWAPEVSPCLPLQTPRHSIDETVPETPDALLQDRFIRAVNGPLLRVFPSLDIVPPSSVLLKDELAQVTEVLPEEEFWDSLECDDRELDSCSPPPHQTRKSQQTDAKKGPFKPAPYSPKITRTNSSSKRATLSPRASVRQSTYPICAAPPEPKLQTWSRATAGIGGSPRQISFSVRAAQRREASSPVNGYVLSSKEFIETRAAYAQQWRAKQYDMCLHNVAACLKMLAPQAIQRQESRSAADDPILVEFRRTAAYRTAVPLVREIAALSTDSSQLPAVALLSKLLCDLPLLTDHRTECLRLAIEKNMAADNFGCAARLIQVILADNPPDSPDFEDDFRVCKAHKWTDLTMAPYECPACRRKISASAPECKCGTEVSFCRLTLKPLQGPVVGKCSMCGSYFSGESFVRGKACPVCEYGNAEEIDLHQIMLELLAQRQAQQQAQALAAAEQHNSPEEQLNSDDDDDDAEDPECNREYQDADGSDGSVGDPNGTT